MVEDVCVQIPPWLQREMVSCTETEQSDSNEADRGSELSDNDEYRRRDVSQPSSAGAQKAVPSPGTYCCVTQCLFSLIACMHNCPAVKLYLLSAHYLHDFVLYLSCRVYR